MFFTSLLPVVISAGFFVLLSVAASLAMPVRWETGLGANGHLYEVRQAPAGVTWEAAAADAQASGARLASLQSAEEAAFVFALAAADTSHWVVDVYGNTIGPWLGGQLGPDGWEWPDGTAFSYTAWGTGQPSGLLNGIPEDRLHYWKEGAALPLPTPAWNDYPAAAAAPGLTLTKPVAYVLEWETAASDPADGDWSAQSLALLQTSQAALMVRAGDIDNLGFGWPGNFNPFSGYSTPGHSYPWTVDPADAPGTDRIMIGSSYNPAGFPWRDGYSQTTQRPANKSIPIVLTWTPPAFLVTSAVLQLFVDDFQPGSTPSLFTATLNGRRCLALEAVINSLDQTGPVGLLITVPLTAEHLADAASGRLEVAFDDATTGTGDGFAVDFVKLLLNPVPASLPNGTVTGHVLEAGSLVPLPGIRVASGLGPTAVTTLTGLDGSYSLPGVPAGYAWIRALGPDFPVQTRSCIVLDNNTTGAIDFLLHRGTPSLDISPEALLSWPTLSGGVYVLQTSTTLGAWQDLHTFAGSGAGIAVQMPVTPGPRRFWRIEQR